MDLAQFAKAYCSAELLLLQQSALPPTVLGVEEMAVIRHYTHGSYLSLNQQLRSGHLQNENLYFAQYLSDALAKLPLNARTLLTYRALVFHLNGWRNIKRQRTMKPLSWNLRLYPHLPK